MGRLGQQIGHFFVGIMFLTRLPVPRGLRHLEGRLARSARYFPLVGVIVGVMCGLTYYVCALALPPLVSAALAVLAGIMITGALHEDGLADCCDGLFGGATRERMLEIMRDSRIGTYGACALIGSFVLRTGAVEVLTPRDGLIALIVAHAVSRAIIPLVLVSGSYARTRGLASSVAEGVSPFEAVFSTLTAVAIAAIAGPVAGLAAFAAAVLMGGLMLTILMRKIGGYTGDGLGAIQQCAEIAVLIVLAGLWA